mmetsp:Transcript_29903/g.44096  ORF Transcript_29903/g.44096 Transcript_29903/m.44096 type:complete len:94 (-) Transcript_29903:225-506(-)
MIGWKRSQWIGMKNGLRIWRNEVEESQIYRFYYVSRRVLTRGTQVCMCSYMKRNDAISVKKHKKYMCRLASGMLKKRHSSFQFNSPYIGVNVY